MEHELKITPENFRQILEGERTFDVRNNDRDFKAGDTVRLRSYDAYDEPRSLPDGKLAAGVYIGLELTRRINRVFTDIQGLQPGYVALVYLPLVNR